MAWRFIPSAAAGMALVAFVAAVLSVSTPAQAQYTGCYAGTTVLCDTKTDTWCSVWAEPDLTIGTSTKTGGRLCMRELSNTYYYYLNTWPTGPGGTGGGTGGTGGSGGSGGAGGSENDDCGNPDLWYDDGADCKSGGNNMT
jgi:hypothetical protein